MNSKVSLFVTLVIVKQFAHIHSLPTTKTPNEAGKQSNFSQLYVFGGLTDYNKLTGQWHVKTVSRLSSISGKWEGIKSMPIAAGKQCGAVVSEKIYLFGGIAEINGNLTVLNAASVYDPMTETYTELASMPEITYACGAAALNGSIYIAGGNKQGSVYQSLLRYEIETNQWSTLSSMHDKRWGFPLIELGGLLYAIGGANNSTEIYNPATDQWSFAENAPHEQYWFFGGAAHEGKIYVYSHYGFEVYCPNTDRWAKLNVPEDYKYNRALVSMNGKLWAIGGQQADTEIIASKVSKAVHTYDTSTGEWTREQDMDVSRGYHIAFVVHN